MKLLTNSFKTFLAKQTLTILTGVSSSFYTIAARSTNLNGWSNTINSVTGIRYDTDREIVFGYKVVQNNISLMVKNIPWLYNTVYQQYDDMLAELSNKNFYVCVSELDGTRSIFKCIETSKKLVNNILTSQPSTDMPSKNKTTLTEKYFRTSDGYVWKYLYNISSGDVTTFSTSELLPITSNTNIANSAVFGEVDSVIVDYPGSNYTKYAYVKIKDAAVGGNPVLFNITAENNKIIYAFTNTANTPFNTALNVNIANTSNSIIGTGSVYYTSNTDIKIITDNDLSLENILPVRLQQGSIDRTYATVSKSITPNLLSLNDAYKDNVLYIRTGTGAGQIRTIGSYLVANNIYTIGITNAFSVIPDNTSRLEILPAISILGDGTGLTCIPRIDQSSNSVIGIDIITPGSGYTYANATITGNNSITNISTGAITQEDKAVIRPIISPLGGHGYDISNELNTAAICISTKFDANTTIANGYNKIGLIGGASFINANTASIFDDRITANTTVLFNGTNNNGFLVGETIIQDEASAIIHEKNGSNYYLTNIRGTFDTTQQIQGNISAARGIINSLSTPNRIKYFCETFYLEDLSSQINRSISQNEYIKIIINF